MAEPPLRLAVIVGSTSQGRFGGVVAAWFVAQARQRDEWALDVIDLADVDLPAVYPRQPGPAVEAFVERMGRADAFVVVTPEYNHGYPVSLKQAIDLSHGQWRAKPMGFVSYGGMAGGLRAVEQLRQVFAELHAVTVRDTVSFHRAHERFDESGEPRDPAGCNVAAETMLDQLAWRAAPLRTARARTMPQTENRATFRRLYEEAFGKGALDVVDAVVDPALRYGGAEGMKRAVTSLRGAFPDLTLTAEDVIADGDRVVGRFTVTGTHEGEYMGIAGTGRAFEIDGVMIVRFRNGRIIELRSVVDKLSLMQQLGAIPTEFARSRQPVDGPKPLDPQLHVHRERSRS